MNLKNFPKKIDSKTSCLRISVPENLDLALEGLIRKVLREQPKTDDIYTFAANYFETLLRIRDKAGTKYLPDQVCPFHNDEDAHEMIKLANTFPKPVGEKITVSRLAQKTKHSSGKLPKKLNKKSELKGKDEATANKENINPEVKKPKVEADKNAVNKDLGKELVTKGLVERNSEIPVMIDKIENPAADEEDFLKSDPIKELVEKELMEEAERKKKEENVKSGTDSQNETTKTDEVEVKEGVEEGPVQEANADELCMVVDAQNIPQSVDNIEEKESPVSEVQEGEDVAGDIQIDTSKTVTDGDTKESLESQKEGNIGTTEAKAGEEEINKEEAENRELPQKNIEDVEIDDSKKEEQKIERDNKDESGVEDTKREVAETPKEEVQIESKPDEERHENVDEAKTKGSEQAVEVKTPENEEGFVEDSKQEIIEKVDEPESKAESLGKEPSKTDDEKQQKDDETKTLVQPVESQAELKKSEDEAVATSNDTKSVESLSKDEKSSLDQIKVSEEEKQVVEKVLEEALETMETKQIAQNENEVEKNATEEAEEKVPEKQADSESENIKEDGKVGNESNDADTKSEDIEVASLETNKEDRTENEGTKEEALKEGAEDESIKEPEKVEKLDEVIPQAEEEKSIEETLKEKVDVSSEETKADEAKIQTETVEKQEIEESPDLKEEEKQQTSEAVEEEVEEKKMPKEETVEAENEKETQETIEETKTETTNDAEKPSETTETIGQIEIPKGIAVMNLETTIEEEIKVERKPEPLEGVEFEDKGITLANIETKIEEEVVISSAAPGGEVKDDVTEPKTKQEPVEVEEEKTEMSKSEETPSVVPSETPTEDKEVKPEPSDSIAETNPSQTPTELCGVVDTLNITVDEAEKSKNDIPIEGRQIKTITTHYYDLLQVPETITKEYRVHHMTEEPPSLPISPPGEDVKLDSLLGEAIEPEVPKTEIDDLMTPTSGFSLNLSETSMLTVSEWFLDSERRHSSVEKEEAIYTTPSISQVPAEEEKKEVEEIIHKTVLPTSVGAVPVPPRESEEIVAENTEPVENKKEDKKPEKSSSEESTDSKNSTDSDVPIISVEVKTVIETQIVDDETEEAIDDTPNVEIEVQATIDIPEEEKPEVGRTNLAEVAAVVQEEFKKAELPDKVDEGSKPVLPTETSNVEGSSGDSVSTASSALTEIKRFDSNKRTFTRSSTQSLLASQSLDSNKRSPLLKTRSLSTFRQGVTDFEVWSTIEKELEKAATKIQSKFRGYKTRKMLRRENAIQIPTEESSVSTTPVESEPKENHQQSTGEFHDTIVLSVHPR